MNIQNKTLKKQTHKTVLAQFLCCASLLAFPITSQAQELAQTTIQYEAIDGLEYTTPNYSETIAEASVQETVATIEQEIEVIAEAGPTIDVQLDAIAGLENSAPNYIEIIAEAPVEEAIATIEEEVEVLAETEPTIDVQLDAIAGLENSAPNYIETIAEAPAEETVAVIEEEVEVIAETEPTIDVQLDAIAGLENSAPNYIETAAPIAEQAEIKIAEATTPTIDVQFNAIDGLENTAPNYIETAQTVTTNVEPAEAAVLAMADDTSAVAVQYNAIEGLENTAPNRVIEPVVTYDSPVETLSIATEQPELPRTELTDLSLPDLDTVQISALDAPQAAPAGQQDNALVESLRTKISLLEREKKALRDALTKRKDGPYEIDMNHVKKRKAEKLNAGEKIERPKSWPFPY